jgi:hypothetical protein
MIAKGLGISLDKASNHVAPEKSHMRGWCKVHTREDLSQLTKGAAADIITRLRSGAKVIAFRLPVDHMLTLQLGCLR